MQPLKYSRFKYGVLGLLGLSLLNFPIATYPTLFTGIVPGLSTVNLPVKSVRAMKFDGIVAQSFDFSCGAAALATLLKYGFQQNVSEASVLQTLMQQGHAEKIKEYGFSLLDLKNYAKAKGFYAQGFQLSTDQLTQLRVPAIVLMDIKGYKHFVVLKKVQNNQVYLADPALGNRVISQEEFTKSWNNILLVIMNKDFDKNSVLANPPAALSVKKLFKLSTPSETQQLDFGTYKNSFF